MRRKLSITSLVLLLTAISSLYLLAFQFTFDEAPRKADVIIVLGCKTSKDGAISIRQRARVEKAIELFKHGWAPRIIFSGSANANKWNEAEVMSKYAITLGIAEERISLEREARSTVENAKNSAAIMKQNGWNRALVVTSSLHTCRAKRIFSALNMDATIVAAPFPSDVTLYARLRAFLFEMGHEIRARW